MSNIYIEFKDGTKKEFLHEGRAGGSYTKEIKFEGGFVIITDEWYHRFVYPAQDIKEVKTKPNRGDW